MIILIYFRKTKEFIIFLLTIVQLIQTLHKEIISDTRNQTDFCNQILMMSKNIHLSNAKYFWLILFI